MINGNSETAPEWCPEPSLTRYSDLSGKGLMAIIMPSPHDNATGPH